MIGLGLGQTAFRSRGVFNPSQLFESATGFWFDGTELSTLWTDTAATTNITSAGQQIAVALDKSRGANSSGGVLTGLGTERSPNVGGPFVNTTGINTTSATLAVVSNNVRITASASSFSFATWQATGMVVGEWYEIRVRARRHPSQPGTTGGIWNASGFAPSSIIALTTTMTTYRYFTQATAATGNVNVYANIGASAIGDQAEVEFVTIRHVPGFHALQTGASFRPQYQATGLRYDGVDDRLVTVLRPAASGTLAARFNGVVANTVMMGSQAPINIGSPRMRAFLGLDANGRLSAGVGDQSQGTIFGGPNLLGAWHTGAVTWDGTTVRLYLNGAQVYSAAQDGPTNNTVSMALGGLAAHGQAIQFWNGDISDQISLDRAATAAEISKLHNFWSA